MRAADIRSKGLRFHQETTEGAEYALNVYVLDRDRGQCYAYIQAGSNLHRVFKKPIRFDPRGRTFRDLGAVI